MVASYLAPNSCEEILGTPQLPKHPVLFVTKNHGISSNLSESRAGRGFPNSPGEFPSLTYMKWTVFGMIMIAYMIHLEVAGSWNETQETSASNKNIYENLISDADQLMIFHMKHTSYDKYP